MVYLYGAGGHAKVVIDVLEALKIKIGAIVDDYQQLPEILGYPVYRNSFLETLDAGSEIIITIGFNETRKEIAEKLKINFLRPIVHPSAIVSKYAFIDIGTVIIHGAIIQAEARIGKHCIVNTGASVGHECNVSNYVHIASNATLCGNVSIGQCTWIGAGSVVIPGVKIGNNCMIGAGSVVVRDIPDNVVVFGNPARVVKTNIKFKLSETVCID